MAENKKDSVITFSLGVEEIALALGLINARGLGQQLINAVYKDVNAENADVRLTVAGHSLLAHGLSKISKEGAPVLEPALEQALFPLVRFDRLIQMSVIREGKLDNASIHVRDGLTFTSHSNQAGIVHVLRHGKSDQLSEYITSLFVDLNTGAKTQKTGGKLTPGSVTEVFKNGRNKEKVIGILTGKGWAKDLAGDLAKELSEETFRAILVRINASQDVSMEALNKSTKPMLVISAGKEKTWLVSFASSDESCEGTLEIVDKKRLVEVVTTFLA